MRRKRTERTEKPRERQRLRYTELRDKVGELAERVKRLEEDVLKLSVVCAKTIQHADDAMKAAIAVQKDLYGGGYNGKPPSEK